MTFSGMTIKCRYANEYHPTVSLFSSQPFLSVSVASCCLFLLALTDNSSSLQVLYKAENIRSLIPDCRSWVVPPRNTSADESIHIFNTPCFIFKISLCPFGKLLLIGA